MKKVLNFKLIKMAMIFSIVTTNTQAFANFDVVRITDQGERMIGIVNGRATDTVEIKTDRGPVRLSLSRSLELMKPEILLEGIEDIKKNTAISAGGAAVGGLAACAVSVFGSVVCGLGAAAATIASANEIVEALSLRVLAEVKIIEAFEKMQNERLDQVTIEVEDVEIHNLFSFNGLVSRDAYYLDLEIQKRVRDLARVK